MSSKSHIILEFKDKHFFLSNFYPCTINLDGIVFPSAEHAFQAHKCQNKEDLMRIINAKSPSEAKRLGRQVSLRPYWEDIKEFVMLRVVKAKFTQNADLQVKLKKTYPCLLVEGNTWGDTYWGVDLRRPDKNAKYGFVGQNRLGEILMLVRRELISIFR